MEKILAVKDLTPGVKVACENRFVTVRRAYREAIFEGDVWCIETDDGNKWADSGLDKVKITAE